MATTGRRDCSKAALSCSHLPFMLRCGHTLRPYTYTESKSLRGHRGLTHEDCVTLQLVIF